MGHGLLFAAAQEQEERMRSTVARILVVLGLIAGGSALAEGVRKIETSELRSGATGKVIGTQAVFAGSKHTTGGDVFTYHDGTISISTGPTHITNFSPSSAAGKAGIARHVWRAGKGETLHYSDGRKVVFQKGLPEAEATAIRDTFDQLIRK
jgi:hypothetical protein